MRLVLAVALCLWASPSWAAPLPDYDTCTLTWTFAEFTIYQQTTPTGPAVKMGRVGPNGPADTTIKSWTFPCPTAQGTYYYTWSITNAEGVEGLRGLPTVFTIKGGAPPLVFVVGGGAQVDALNLLNVRSSPGGPVLGTQKRGAAARIIGGPVVLTSPPAFAGIWWQLNYPTGADGWSMQNFLVPTS